MTINFITDSDKENLLKIENELGTEIKTIPGEFDHSKY